MGLRDRLSAKFYMPLVAGVDAARRGGPLAPSLYTPGLDPDDPSTGDGGIDAVRDPNIARPSITSPLASATDVEVDATVTSSAFASTDGQTHAKSRWVIEQRSDVDGPARTMVWWDSGPTSTDLTSISLEAANLGRDITYAIRVRHKGAPGIGWSAWSPYRVFTTRGCGEVTYSCTQYRSEDVSNWPEYTGTWRSTLQEVADDVAAAETEHQDNGITYVGYVDGTSIEVYNPTFPGSCTVPATCLLVSSRSSTSRTGLYCTTPDPCVELPDPYVPDPEDPDEEPVFVPPPDPPVDPDPEDPDGYAEVFLNPQTSWVTAMTVPKTLAEASSDGGIVTGWYAVTVQLAFNNSGTATGSLDYAVKCPGSTSMSPTGLQRVTITAHGTVIKLHTIYLPTNVAATYTIEVDTGEEDTFEVDVGFTPADPGSDI